MTHARKTIRDAAVSLLTGQTAAGARVFSNVIYRFKPADLPAINVVTADEKAEIYGESTRTMKRTLRLWVEVIGKDVVDQNIDDTLDGIAEAVELKFALDETLNTTASDCVYAETQLFVTDEGQAPMATLRIGFDVTYYTVPEFAAPADEFLTGHYVLRPSDATTDSPAMTGDITLDQ
jgi:hypothetical protein